ncbi:MAG: pantoate--beta-alanine ligase [Bacteroidales bacterium]|nr:pantoate--beta-alanine ligase [Bacteroidales bacterium]
MEIFKTIAEIRECLADVRKSGHSIGFVPTMGALHNGHLSLVKASGKDNRVTVASIFVNPVQFNDSEDFRRYPRDIGSDTHMLESAACDVLFCPGEKEIYPEPPTELVDLGGLDSIMEGKYRPGHFNGVVTIVKRLLEIIEPNRAYFGLKDYQQLVIIHHIVTRLNLPVEIIPCPIVREKDGLAMSSRNRLLSRQERAAATFIYKALRNVKAQAGYIPIPEIAENVEYLIRSSKYLKLEYFEIVDMYSLRPVRFWTESRNLIACIAVYAGDVRLIDNVILFS